MALRIALCLLSFLCVEARRLGAPSPPVWPESYHAEGIINLPYAEIGEPFEVWYDGENQRSRIDYYCGIVESYQFSKDSKSYLISPWTTEEKLNELACFEIDGPIKPQSVFPANISAFEYQGDEEFEGVPCYNFRMTATIGKKMNVYTMTVTQEDKVPKRYEMRGYDTLFGSHYDKYEVLYISFDTGVPKPETFNTPKDSAKDRRSLESSTKHSLCTTA